MAHNLFDAAGREAFLFTTTLIAVNVLAVSSLQIGILNAAETIAFLVFGLLTGRLADRTTTRLSLAVASVTKTTVAAVLASCVALGQLSFTYVLLSVLAFGVAMTLSEAAQVSAIPRVEPVSDRRVTLASRLASADTAATILVPGGVGVLSVLIGMAEILLLAVIVCVVALILVGPIGSAKAPSGDASPHVRAFLRSAFVGFEALWASSQLRLLSLASAAGNFGLAVMGSVEAIYLLRELDFTTATFGFLTLLGGVGGLIGSLVAPRITSEERQRLCLAAAVYVQVLLAVLLLSAQYLTETGAILVVAIQSVVWGFVVVLSNVIQIGWSVRIIPEDILGSTFAARRTITFGVIPAGSLIGGAIGATLGLSAALLVWLLALMIAAVLVSKVMVTTTEVSHVR